MKKFTLLKEELESKKYFQAKVEVTIQVEAQNEGEAGYMFDRILGGIEEQVDYTISIIEEVSAMSIKND